jgi:hydroxymethylpyrimidine pyrophosphatase-like HAD family hydrolase
MTSFLSPEMEKKVRINIPDCEFSRWNPAFVDINASGCTKSTGMDIMCKYFGISPAESVAFGDGGNDISIIKHAGTGIAMGQAGDNVKRSADYVTTSVDEDGISNALKKLVL